MRRRVLGFNKVLEELRKGNCILEAPISAREWMIIDNEVCTVRNDFLTKAYKKGMKFERCLQKGGYAAEIRLVQPNKQKGECV